MADPDLALESMVDSHAEGKKRPRDEKQEGAVLAEGTENAAKKLRPKVAEEETPTPDAAEAGNYEETPPAAAEKGEGEKEPEGPGLGDGENNGEATNATEAKLGPMAFTSSMDMFNFFYHLLRAWPINFNVNKYEHWMLEELINKGHQDPQKKIGAGIEAFQVRINPDFYSRCFYVVRKDGSVEDFSYRKCVDNILPLPEDFRTRSGDLRLHSKQKGQGGFRGPHDNRGNGGRFGGGRGGHGRGNHGRGGGRRF